MSITVKYSVYTKQATSDICSEHYSQIFSLHQTSNKGHLQWALQSNIQSTPNKQQGTFAVNIAVKYSVYTKQATGTFTVSITVKYSVYTKQAQEHSQWALQSNIQSTPNKQWGHSQWALLSKIQSTPNKQQGTFTVSITVKYIVDTKQATRDIHSAHYSQMFSLHQTSNKGHSQWALQSDIQSTPTKQQGTFTVSITVKYSVYTKQATKDIHSAHYSQIFSLYQTSNKGHSQWALQSNIQSTLNKQQGTFTVSITVKYSVYTKQATGTFAVSFTVKYSVYTKQATRDIRSEHYSEIFSLHQTSNRDIRSKHDSQIFSLHQTSNKEHSQWALQSNFQSTPNKQKGHSQWALQSNIQSTSNKQQGTFAVSITVKDSSSPNKQQGTFTVSIKVKYSVYTKQATRDIRSEHYCQRFSLHQTSNKGHSQWVLQSTIQSIPNKQQGTFTVSIQSTIQSTPNKQQGTFTVSITVNYSVYTKQATRDIHSEHYSQLFSLHQTSNKGHSQWALQSTIQSTPNKQQGTFAVSITVNYSVYTKQATRDIHSEHYSQLFSLHQTSNKGHSQWALQSTIQSTPNKQQGTFTVSITVKYSVYTKQATRDIHSEYYSQIFSLHQTSNKGHSQWALQSNIRSTPNKQQGTFIVSITVKYSVYTKQATRDIHSEHYSQIFGLHQTSNKGHSQWALQSYIQSTPNKQQGTFIVSITVKYSVYTKQATRDIHSEYYSQIFSLHQTSNKGHSQWALQSNIRSTPNKQQGTFIVSITVKYSVYTKQATRDIHSEHYSQIFSLHQTSNKGHS